MYTRNAANVERDNEANSASPAAQPLEQPILEHTIEPAAPRVETVRLPDQKIEEFVHRQRELFHEKSPIPQTSADMNSVESLMDGPGWWES